MMRSVAVVVGVLGVTILAGVAGLLNSGPVSAAQNQAVTVTNTPLPVQGAVSAAQGGTWTVGINGTPSVTIANNLLNTRDRNLAIATPVSFTDVFSIPNNVFGSSSNAYVVPANTRLVVQYVSMSCDLGGSADAEGRLSSDQGNPGSSSYMGVFVPMRSVPYPAAGAGVVRATGGSPAQVLLDAATSFQISVERTNGTGSGTCFVGFTGYLLSLP